VIREGVGGQKIYTLFSPALAGKVWATGHPGKPKPIALGSIGYSLASPPYTAVRAGNVYSLTGPLDSEGWARYGAQLDGQNG